MWADTVNGMILVADLKNGDDSALMLNLTGLVRLDIGHIGHANPLRHQKPIPLDAVHPIDNLANLLDKVNYIRQFTNSTCRDKENSPKAV